MKQIKNIRKHIEWEMYYDPNFDWNNEKFYKENILEVDFIKHFFYKINWCFLSQSWYLNADYLNEFKDNLDWFYISQNIQILTEDLLIRFKDYFCSNDILKYRYLCSPEDFSLISKDFLNTYFDLYLNL